MQLQLHAHTQQHNGLLIIIASGASNKSEAERLVSPAGLLMTSFIAWHKTYKKPTGQDYYLAI